MAPHRSTMNTRRAGALTWLVLALVSPLAAQAEYLPVAVGASADFPLASDPDGPIATDPLGSRYVYGEATTDLAFPSEALVDVLTEMKTFPSHLDPIYSAVGPPSTKGRRDVLKVGVKRVSPLDLEVAGEQVVAGSKSMRWAFQVEPDDDHAAGEVVRALVSGTLWAEGELFVYGSGSARFEVRASVKHRLDAELGGASRSAVVGACIVASHEIAHSYDYSVDLGLGVTIGDGIEVDGDFGAGRDFLFEHRAVEERYPFSLPLLVQVGESYELDVTLFGAAVNRGLFGLHRSVVRFGVTFVGGGEAPDGSGEPGPEDPGHMLDAIAFFSLQLPQPAIGKPFSGKATFKFPKLLGLFDGKTIEVGNDLALEPIGKVGSVAEVLEKLSLPLNPGEKMAGSAPPGAAEAPPTTLGTGAAEGGLWLQDLRIVVQKS